MNNICVVTDHRGFEIHPDYVKECERVIGKTSKEFADFLGIPGNDGRLNHILTTVRDIYQWKDRETNE